MIFCQQEARKVELIGIHARRYNRRHANSPKEHKNPCALAVYCMGAEGENDWARGYEMLAHTRDVVIKDIPETNVWEMVLKTPIDFEATLQL